MKRVMSIFLAFVLVMAVLLGVSQLWDHFSPAQPEATPTPRSGVGTPGATEEPAEEISVINDMDASGATIISFREGDVSYSGLGVSASAANDGALTVNIAYPGTYRLEGICTNGQVTVDLGSFGGGVYLILNGLSLTSVNGPAIYIKQADLVVVYSAEGTSNFLQDGESYLVQEGQEKKTGAGIFSADDLIVTGEGSLSVMGRASDGIRSKDSLSIDGAKLTVFAADDALQGSDYVAIEGGSLSLSAGGDGISTTNGNVTVSDTNISISSGRDGIDAVTDLSVKNSVISVTACGGPENYAETVNGQFSAKGLKAEGISLTDSELYLETADDGIHAARDIAIASGEYHISSGDDAIHAAGVLNILGGTFVIDTSYEGFEGDSLLLANLYAWITADNNGMDAGEGGVTVYSSYFNVTAPRAISSDGHMTLMGVTMEITSDGSDSLFSFTGTNLLGCSILASTPTGDSDVLLKKGTLPGSMLFGFNDPVPAGTVFTLNDPAGNTVYSFVFDRDVTEVMLVMDGLLNGQSYTLNAGENTHEFTYSASGVVISEQEPPINERSGWGGNGGGMPGGWGR